MPALAAFANIAAAAPLTAVQQSALTSTMSLYEECGVKIELLTIDSTKDLNGVTNTVNVNLSGIDSNCPDLSATIWMETPENYNNYETGAYI